MTTEAEDRLEELAFNTIRPGRCFVWMIASAMP